MTIALDAGCLGLGLAFANRHSKVLMTDATRTETSKGLGRVGSHASPAIEHRLSMWGMLPLRLVVGLVFLMHGGQKLFVFGLSGTADIMGKLGIPLPSLAAAIVIAAELLGGAAIILGVFTRWAGVILAIEMLVAIPVARFAGGFFAPYGFEFEFTLLGACLTFAALGSGGASLDRFVGGSRQAI